MEWLVELNLSNMLLSSDIVNNKSSKPKQVPHTGK